MQSNKNSLSILVSPAFFVGLGLLLLNDFVLKPAFHNWFTGKLSDFAGLFIFPLFFSALFPVQKNWIYGGTTIGFVFWKSEFSQLLIDLWNVQPYYHLDRVVDYADLLALLVLPLSFHYAKQHKRRRAKSLLVYVSCLLSVFAFAATSVARQKITYIQDYKFEIPQAQLIARIEQLSELQFPGQAYSDAAKNDYLFRSKESLPVTFEFPFEAPLLSYVRILVIAEGKSSKVSLVSIAIRNPRKPTPEEEEKLRRSFEKEFIEKLSLEPVRKSSQIKEIWFLAQH